MCAEQLTVLVVDDEPDMRDFLATLLHREGHQVVPAGSAEEGLEQLPYFTFDLAFLDQNLPGMNGLVLGAYMRENNPQMTVVLVTGDDDPRLVRRGASSAIDVIHKPCSPSDILDAVGRHRARVESSRQATLARLNAPPIAEHAAELRESYELPPPPHRLVARLEREIKRHLSDLRTERRYSEAGRVAALAGLVAALVLGVELQNVAPGRSPWDEYDRIMEERGLRTEFTPPPPPGDDAH